MRNLLIIPFLLIATLAFGAKDTGCTKPVNDKYSFKGFAHHGLSFKDRPASDFNNTCIKGSSFYQEWVEGDTEIIKDIFPDGMTGVEFVRCNMDNIEVKIGNTVDATSSRNKIKVQNDLEDWKLDSSLKALEPMDKDRFIEEGKSIDPKDIPSEKITP